MRDLKFKDLGKMAKIINKANLKDEVKALDVKADTETVGANFIFLLLEKYPVIEDELTDFLADIVGTTPEQFKDLNIDVVFGYLQEIFKNKLDFFKQAANLTR